MLVLEYNCNREWNLSVYIALDKYLYISYMHCLEPIACPDRESTQKESAHKLQ